jgi:hypothetical protein
MRVYDTENDIKKYLKSFSWCQFKLQNEAVEREKSKNLKLQLLQYPVNCFVGTKSRQNHF